MTICSCNIIIVEIWTLAYWKILKLMLLKNGAIGSSITKSMKMFLYLFLIDLTKHSLNVMIFHLFPQEKKIYSLQSSKVIRKLPTRTTFQRISRCLTDVKWPMATQESQLKSKRETSELGTINTKPNSDKSL